MFLFKAGLLAGVFSSASGQGLPEAVSCYSCEIYKDHLGNILGAGDPNCWDSPEKSPELSRTCHEAGDICIVDMIVDWWPKGEMGYHISRHCGHPSENRPVCYEEDYYKYMWKDCRSTCTNDNCNNNFDDIAARFDSGNKDLKCHQCKYARDFDGTILPNSNENCGLPDVTGEIPMVNETCPIYANAGCYMASTFYKGGDDFNSNIHEDYKGCSTFEIDRKYCESFELDGEEYTSCKETCSGNHCNFLTHQAGDSALSNSIFGALATTFLLLTI